MPRLQPIEICMFDGLDDDAKETARQWWREATAGDYNWTAEWRESQDEDEYIDDQLIANQYEFTADGQLYR